MNELVAYSATQQARLIRERRVSSRELVMAHLEQIAAINPEINAAVAVLAEQALAEATAADSGEPRGPLHGVPFSVKDSFELAGTVATAGTLGRKNAPRSTEDAALVKRLRRAGAIPMARTNLPDLLFAFESDNLIYGATRNPYDTARTPGGSSGGEAALHAACGSPLGLGSDCAGSVRVPAAFCGTAAIKPTSGRLPRTGHFPPAGGWIEALWQAGPMARRVEDLVTVMPLLAGPDGRDHTVVDMPLENPRSVRVRDLRLAFYTDNGLAAADEEVAGVVRAAAAALAEEGSRVEEARPACLGAAYEIEMKLIGPDGGDSLRGYLRDIGSTNVHPLLTAWLDKVERYRTGIDGFARYWSEWFVYGAEMTAFLARGYDAIVCPAYIHAALPLGTSTLEENFIGFSHTMAYNVAGWPAAVVRCGESAAGLPIAVQIAAAPWREDVALAVALWLERAFGGWKPPAGIHVSRAAGAPVVDSVAGM
jgi:amidase